MAETRIAESATPCSCDRKTGATEAKRRIGHACMQKLSMSLPEPTCNGQGDPLKRKHSLPQRSGRQGETGVSEGMQHTDMGGKQLEI